MSLKGGKTLQAVFREREMWLSRKGQKYMLFLDLIIE